jgi:hypothetical protein
MSLMGIVILSNTRTELSITGNNRLGREAFNSADATARMATFLTLALLNPRTEDVSDVITSGSVPTSPQAPRYPVAVCPKSNFKLETLVTEATNYNFTNRYLDTGAGEAAANPHIEFKLGDCSTGRPIANAVVNLETYNLLPEGMSLATGDPNDSSGGPRLLVGVIVSVKAETSMDVAAGADSPNSLVTIMYRNYMN